ncbi:MAG: S9 family peptidase [Acidobacteria bacterium]|nr:S9 family peptidase [Acidobacteriota bacterium]
MLAAPYNKRLSESPAFNPPPYTPVEPVVERLHGVEVVDPYRWLEDQNSTRTRQWLAQQAAYTRAYFDRIPSRKRIRERVAELLDVEAVSEPRKVGDRYFYLKRTAGQEQPVIMMREGNGGTEISLMDPAEMGLGSSIAVNILCVSNDGKLLAYSVRRGGEDSCEIRFLDVERRQVLPDRLPTGFCRGLAFFPDARGFFYVHRPIRTPRPYYRAVLRHFFGTDLESDTEMFFAGEHSQLHLGMSASPDGQLLGYSVTRVGDKCKADFFVHDITSSRPPKRIVERMEGLFVPAFVQNRLVALTDWNAPNGRIVSIGLDHPSLDAWRQIVPEVTSRIRDFVVVGDLIFVGYVENLETRIAIFTCSGEWCGTLPCPGAGTARLLPVQANSDVLFYRYSSFAHPPAIFCYRTQTRDQCLWANSEIQFAPSSFEVQQVRYPSKDRAIVPMFLVSRKGQQGGGPLPTFLTGYGGFGTSLTPQFTAYATFLIERGCLFAVANVRGGSELGQKWHEAGKRHNRQNAIDDFIG